jgi:hypothetical protein
MAQHFVRDLGEANNEEHAWQMCVRLREQMSRGALKEFKRKKYVFKAHKIRSKWHACLFQND